MCVSSLPPRTCRRYVMLVFIPSAVIRFYKRMCRNPSNVLDAQVSGAPRAHEKALMSQGEDVLIKSPRQSPEGPPLPVAALSGSHTCLDSPHASFHRMCVAMVTTNELRGSMKVG